ncbi:EAL domain-containing protein [Acidithiobacillus thiooxidans]|uniref:putative bifunctional diguanylate cyclase/phosphodiesterase n=1 Tax=Acidithiobacillus thiooxidans TaxID=930 RepID=UPI001C07D522|nr:EAL domain-containing protein [Acidithiobacillus thiooxidans]MBU2837964.1 EAL domain-containing protein [Acidithiobacillus thiooxidans]
MTFSARDTQSLMVWVNLSDREREVLLQWNTELQQMTPALMDHMTALLQQHPSLRNALPDLQLLPPLQPAWLQRLFCGVYDASFWTYQESIGQQLAANAFPSMGIAIGLDTFRTAFIQCLQETIPNGWIAELQTPLLRLLDPCHYAMQSAYTQARLQSLTRDLRQLLQHYDLVTFFEQAADLAQIMAGADGAGLILRADGQLHYRFFHGLSSHYTDLAGIAFPETAGNAGQAFQENRAVYLRDYPASGTAMPEFVAAGLKASLAIPLLGPEGPIGVLVLSWFQSPAPEQIPEDHWEYLRLLADLLGAQLHRETLEERLQNLAAEDLLTGLPNRRVAKERLHRAMARSYRHQRLFALFFMDLDGFKAINDQMGHHQGDVVLQQVAQDIQKVLRTEDSLLRYAGDEFLIIVEDLRQVSEIEEMAVRILSAVHREVRQNYHHLPLSASLGIVIYPLDDGDPESLLHQADLAMYAAKQAGGNRWAFYDSRLSEMAQKNQEILHNLQHSDENQEFLLYWQPIVTLPERRLSGVEALLRWQHPEKGLLSPSDFIGALEGNHRLMQTTGRWVLASAFAVAADWHGRGYLLDVHINVAAAQLEDPQFLTFLQSLLQQHPEVQGQHIWLEIVERAALEDITRMAALVASCRPLGIRFTLDDFGTGAAPLKYLIDLDCGGIKLDKSMVDAAVQSDRHARFLQAIVDMAHDLSLHVVAEGVETEETLKLLETIGVTQVQGYLLGRPMTQQAMEKRLLDTPAQG